MIDGLAAGRVIACTKAERWAGPCPGPVVPAVCTWPSAVYVNVKVAKLSLAPVISLSASYVYVIFSDGEAPTQVSPVSIAVGVVRIGRAPAVGVGHVHQFAVVIIYVGDGVPLGSVTVVSRSSES